MHCLQTHSFSLRVVYSYIATPSHSIVYSFKLPSWHFPLLPHEIYSDPLRALLPWVAASCLQCSAREWGVCQCLKQSHFLIHNTAPCGNARRKHDLIEPVFSQQPEGKEREREREREREVYYVHTIFRIQKTVNVEWVDKTKYIIRINRVSTKWTLSPKGRRVEEAVK